VAAAIAAALPAGAQEAQGVHALEEIVVTARKSAENLQTVPVSITAFTAEDIEAAGIRDLRDVAALTPGLVFDTMIGEYLAIPTIRGLTQNDVFGDVNNVEIFLDGVNVSGRSGLNFNLLDVERIEVVKGPQSALYGRNSFAGAINFVTRRAPDEFSGRVSATGGSEGTLRGAVHLGGPILENLRGRLSVGYDEFDGSYRNNSFPGHELGGHEYRTWSGGLEWDPTDAFSVRANAYYSDDEIGPPAVGFVRGNCELNGAGQALAFCGELPEANLSALGADPRGVVSSAKYFARACRRTGAPASGRLPRSPATTRCATRRCRTPRASSARPRGSILDACPRARSCRRSSSRSSSAVIGITWMSSARSCASRVAKTRACAGRRASTITNRSMTAVSMLAR